MDTRMNATLSSLSAQRNGAMDTIAAMDGEISVLREENEALKKQITELRNFIETKKDCHE